MTPENEKQTMKISEWLLCFRSVLRIVNCASRNLIAYFWAKRTLWIWNSDIDVDFLKSSCTCDMRQFDGRRFFDSSLLIPLLWYTIQIHWILKEKKIFLTFRVIFDEAQAQHNMQFYRVQTNLENQGKPGKVVIFKVFQGISGKDFEKSEWSGKTQGTFFVCQLFHSSMLLVIFSVLGLVFSNKVWCYICQFGKQLISYFWYF